MESGCDAFESPRPPDCGTLFSRPHPGAIHRLESSRGKPISHGGRPAGRPATTPMKSTKLKAALLTAIAALGITGYFLQRRFDARLEAQSERLRQAAAENARL